jgi:hypothetical protein
MDRRSAVRHRQQRHCKRFAGFPRPGSPLHAPCEAAAASSGMNAREIGNSLRYIPQRVAASASRCHGLDGAATPINTGAVWPRERMEVPLLLGLIVLNGLFAMSEIALVTARKARLQKLAEDGDRSSLFALCLGEDPTSFLSTIQIGITSISILNGIVGEAILARPPAIWLQSLGAVREVSEIGATALVVIVITYLSIVLGELVPKRLGQMNPEPIARFVARSMLWLAALAKPFVRLLSASTNLCLRLLGARASRSNAVTEEEIHAMLAEGSDAQRLAALVPRPRLHLIRFHGVLAPHAKLRAAIVPSLAAEPSGHAAEHAHHRPARMS